MRKGTAATLVCLTLAAAEAWAGQSLGQVAAAEAARRKAITEPARVITQEELPAGPPAPVPEAPAPPDAGDDPRPALIRSAARLRGGGVPQQPPLAVSGGEVALELSVSATGAVTDVAVLRATPPFTEALTAAVRSWRFEPATDAPAPPAGATAPTAGRAVPSRVLVLGLFRPPALFPTTLGTPPEAIAAPSESVPAPRAFPPMPVFPPNGLFDGVVLAELRVGADGALGQTRILQSGAAFDRPTIEAVSALGFLPARVHERNVPAFVYVVAGFRQPITR